MYALIASRVVPEATLYTVTLKPMLVLCVTNWFSGVVLL